jgi:hypothetical protein
VDREQTCGLAAIQLERVRSQMAEALTPLKTLLQRANVGVVYMERELGFECLDIWGLEFVRPFTLWTHLEVWTRDWSSAMAKTFKGSPYKKYSPADIALLEDPAKRQIYIEAHTDNGAPCYREVATILATKGHLLERPPPTYLDGVHPDGVTDWTKFLGGSLVWLQYDMAAFADAWAPLERRWEAGDFARMQPAQPNPWHALLVVNGSMMLTAGARQKELEGASTMSGRKNASDALFGLEASGTEDDT